MIRFGYSKGLYRYKRKRGTGNVYVRKKRETLWDVKGIESTNDRKRPSIGI